MITISDQARLFSRLDYDSLTPMTDLAIGGGSCWLWTGYICKDGYGRIWYAGRSWLVHRFAYYMFYGPPPVDRELDHLCRNRRCCNPHHLEPVTPEENKRRARAYADRMKTAIDRRCIIRAAGRILTHA